MSGEKIPLIGPGRSHLEMVQHLEAIDLWKQYQAQELHVYSGSWGLSIAATEGLLSHQHRASGDVCYMGWKKGTGPCTVWSIFTPLERHPLDTNISTDLTLILCKPVLPVLIHIQETLRLIYSRYPQRPHAN